MSLASCRGTSPVVLPDVCRYHRIKRTGFQCNGTDSCKRRHVGLLPDSFVLLHVAVVVSLVGGGGGGGVCGIDGD